MLGLYLALTIFDFSPIDIVSCYQIILVEVTLYNILRYLYSFAIVLAMPFIFLKLYLRSFKLPAYRSRWLERLGYATAQLPSEGIWLHAVSVGEVVAALPLINALLTSYPQLPITVTTTTPTGSQRLKQSMGDKVTHIYMPYDLSLTLQPIFNKLRPRLMIVMETELWPNLLHQCQQREIPVVIVNGRISDKSLVGYARIKNFTAAMLNQVTMICAQSVQDAERFKILGLAANKVVVSGNLKFDVQISDVQQQLGKELKTSVGNRIIWIAASTHAGEETKVLAAFKELRQQHPDLLLLLVPRHPDRFNEVATVIEQADLTYVRRSADVVCTNDIAVLLGDTMGEMNVFYSAADIALVCGSLMPIGGHNLLEPASAGVAILTGPYFSNFQEITEKLLENNAVVVVQDHAQLCAQMLLWLNEPQQRAAYGKRALAVIEKNRGATAKVLNKLALYLDQSLDLA